MEREKSVLVVRGNNSYVWTWCFSMSMASLAEKSA